jgi:predicted phosphodiesterase
MRRYPEIRASGPLMRIAIVSDIHGNLTAFEAILGDLRQTAPDLILHGGDLAHGGARPAEIVDHIRALGWQGVVGNTDEMLFRPQSLTEFASQSAKTLQPVFTAIEEMAATTREAVGEERIAWLQGLPRTQIHGPMALVHASPESLWRAPSPEAADAELEQVYGPLGQPIAVYAHIHRSYIRNVTGVRSVSGLVVVNTGSVSLSYDGDRRSAYLLLDDLDPVIRRVEYDVERELKALSECGPPHSDWVARTLETGRPQMP